MGKIYDIVVYGHYTHDIIVAEGREESRLGGPPAYISNLMKTLSVDYHVVTKVGKDFRYHDIMHQEPMIGSKPTTTFHNTYSGEDRIQKSYSMCDNIFPEDVVPARIALIAGVLGEVLPETLKEIRKQSEKVIVDIQALIRRTDAEGNIKEIPLMDTEYMDILKEVDIITANEMEYEYMNKEKLSPVVILKLGKDGCTIIDEEKSTIVPTESISEGDSTGAGDMFIAGFAYALLKGRSLLECAQTANKTGALALREIGVPKLTEEDISEVL